MHASSPQDGTVPQTILVAAAGSCHQILPEFGTVDDACRIFGVGRTKLYSYIKRGLVRSICLREPGKATGKRLIYLVSLRQFLMLKLEEAEASIKKVYAETENEERV